MSVFRDILGSQAMVGRHLLAGTTGFHLWNVDRVPAQMSYHSEEHLQAVGELSVSAQMSSHSAQVRGPYVCLVWGFFHNVLKDSKMQFIFLHFSG